MADQIEQGALPADTPPSPEAPPEHTAEQAAASRPAARLGSKIANAASVPNTGGFENRTALAKSIVAKMAGHNNGGYELRVIQESGQH